MDDLLTLAFQAIQKEQAYAFATIVDSTLKGTPRKVGAKMLVLQDGSLFGSIGGGRNEKNAQLECLKAIKNNQPTTVTYKFDEQPGNSICGGEIKVFIEPFLRKNKMVICGAGHIALPLSFLAKMVGYKVIVIDSRPEFANPKRFPHIDQILLGDPAEHLKKLKLDKNTYVLMVTHGYEHDFRCLEVALRSSVAYVGFISSKVKKVKFIRRLREKGYAESKIKKIHAPLGLNIGAQTPQEIAISIMSEIIALNYGKLDQSLKFDYAY